MAIKQNIVIDSGADFSIEFDVTDIADDPIDFGSSEAIALLKKHFYSANSVSFTTSCNANGVITLTMSSDITKDLDPGRYVYDVIIDDGSTKSRIVEGLATITPGVTK